MNDFNLKPTEIQLSTEQQTAIDMATDLTNRIMSVTGGAGTGKTTILKHLHAALVSDRRRVLLAAPTGRAAKRIQEATGIEAKTIHRLLEFPAPQEVEESKGKLIFGEPKRNHYNPLPCDVLILDESSMLSSRLWRYILDALPKHASIRLFGDINQLPPIDDELPPGDSIFKRLLNEKPKMYLNYNFRSDDNLIESANRILHGTIPKRGPKFEILITDDPLGTLSRIVPNSYHTTEHQVITPMRKGQVGSVRLSALLRTKFNLSAENERIELARAGDTEKPITVFAGDKIIWTKNDYVLNIMNGELGIIDEIDPDGGTLSLILDDNRHVIIPPSLKGPFNNTYDPRKYIDLAYAMTTHKSQGSEFDTVIYFMTRSHAFMLNRNNFYTGVTRARNLVTVICDSYAMRYAMRKPKS